MPHIISIAWYKVWPPVFGGQRGIADFTRALSAHVPVTMVCSSNNQQLDEGQLELLPVLPVSKSQFLMPGVWRRIALLARQKAATHIILEHPYHGIAAMRVAKRTGAKLILHAHNIEAERFRMLGKWWWKLLMSYERWVFRRAALCIFKTVADESFAVAKYGVSKENCMVIPYGVEKPTAINDAGMIIRKRHGIGPGTKILLFAGSPDYPPNAAAIDAIINQLLPLLTAASHNYKILICGGTQTGTPTPNVIFAGQVQDIEMYFDAADIFINTVSSGAGIQTKTIEAISHGCTVIAFESMCAGIPTEITGKKLRRVTDKDWSAYVQEIDDALQCREPTPDRFYNFFSWSQNMKPLIAWIKQESN